MEQIKLSKEQEDFILSNFGILFVREMSEILDIKERSITYFCTKSKLKLSSEQKSILFKRRKRKYYMNEKFFNVISNNSVYWAGFIAADGCIIDNRLKIKLKSTDEEHLLRFLTDIESNYNILHEVGNRNGTITYGSIILLTSENYIKDLSEIYNISSKKSLTLIPPNIIDNNYIDCFIKGVFDGDGTIYIKDGSFCIRFYGTLAINTWIKNRIDTIYPKNSGSIFKKDNIYCYELNKNATLFFLEHYKKIETPELYRKWNKELNEFKEQLIKIE